MESAPSQSQIKAHVQKPAHNYDDEFGAFWEVYPRKQGKLDALKAYTTARKSESAETILSGAQTYALAKIGEAQTFIKLPAGWIREQRWEDEPPAVIAPPTQSGIVTPRTCAHDYPIGECEYCVEGGQPF